MRNCYLVKCRVIEDRIPPRCLNKGVISDSWDHAAECARKAWLEGEHLDVVITGIDAVQAI